MIGAGTHYPLDRDAAHLGQTIHLVEIPLIEVWAAVLTDSDSDLFVLRTGPAEASTLRAAREAGIAECFYQAACDAEG